MPTDIRKLNIDDLLGRLYYANVNHEWDEAAKIKAEIARRISVRDRVVRQFMEDGVWDAIDFNHGTTVRADFDYNPTYYDKNGEQIL